MAEIESLAYALLVISLGLIIIAAVLAAVYEGDDSEDAVDDAEWIIRDYCNGINNCEACSRYDHVKKNCKYKLTIPGKWTEDDINDVRRKERNTSRLRKM